MKKSNSIPVKYIGIAIVLIALVAYGVYQYTSTKDNNKLLTSASIQVSFADGTTKTFDSNTMALGALYDPNTNAPLTSISTIIKIKPVVQASDGSYPTSLPAGYSLTRDDSTGGMIILVNGVNIGLNTPTLIPQGGVLTPNTDNVLVNYALTSTQLNQIDSQLSIVSGTFQIQYTPATLNFVAAKLTKPDGTSTTQSVGSSSPTISMSIKKMTSSSGTTTYTLQSVTMSGGFS